MYGFNRLYCYYCSSEVAILTDDELAKLNGLSFQCDCCGHLNQLNEKKFNKSVENDPFLNISSYYAL